MPRAEFNEKAMMKTIAKINETKCSFLKDKIVNCQLDSSEKKGENSNQ